MMHVVLDPLELRRYHILKTKVELYLTEAKLDIYNKKFTEATTHVYLADTNYTELKLFVMICEMAFFSNSDGIKELRERGLTNFRIEKK